MIKRMKRTWTDKRPAGNIAIRRGDEYILNFLFANRLQVQAWTMQHPISVTSLTRIYPNNQITSHAPHAPS